MLELSLLMTTLASDGKTVYIPNSQLSQKVIMNIRRSGDMFEPISLQVKSKNSFNTLDILHRKMTEFVRAQPSRYKGSCTMDIVDFNADYMTCRFSLDYKGNWQNGLARHASRTAFIKALKTNSDELDILLHTPS